MPAATNKTELIEVTQREYRKLEKLITGIEAAEALAKDSDDVSIKDVITHREHWITRFFAWYEDGAAGREVFFPAKGYKWNQLKAYNAALREQHRDITWPQACAALGDAHERLLRFLKESSDALLYGGPMAGANNDWSTGRWAEASGASHYRSAAKYLRARLKALRT